MRRRLRRRALRWLVRYVGRSPEKRLEWLMSGRSRQRIIGAVKRGMERRFNPDGAGDLAAVVEFWVTGERGDNWQLAIDDGSCRVTEALEREPDLIVEIDGVLFLKLVTGNADGQALFLEGDLKLDGDLLLATRLPALFRRARR